MDIVGPLGLGGPHWALVGRALVGQRALVGPTGPDRLAPGDPHDRTQLTG